MNRQEEIMPHSLLSLAGQIQSPDDVPALCLREAAAMIESLVSERDKYQKALNEIAKLASDTIWKINDLEKND